MYEMCYINKLALPLRVYFQIFKKLYHFTNTYTYIYKPSIISLANGDSIAKVSVEGCRLVRCQSVKRYLSRADLLTSFSWMVHSLQ